MTDIVSPDKRSKMMAGIKGKDTRPEILIRKALHRQGFRYSLHRKDLPGKPDLVLPKYNAVIFINGCFWHAHDCHLFKWPKTRPEFWREKIGGNKERDKRNLDKLSELGWRVLIIWECALKGRQRLDFEQVLTTASNWLKSESDNWTIEVKNQ